MDGFSEIRYGGEEWRRTLSNSFDSFAMAARMYSSESSLGSGFLSDMMEDCGRVHKIGWIVEREMRVTEGTTESEWRVHPKSCLRS